MVFSWTSSLVWFFFCLVSPVLAGPVMGMIPLALFPAPSSCCRDGMEKGSSPFFITTGSLPRAGPCPVFSSRAGP